MQWVFVIILFTCSLGVITAVIYELNDDEYYKMPPIVALDPYERCLRHPDGLYCSAYFAYVADHDSPLLHQMQEYSEQTRTHFNHTRVLLGTCVTSTCKHLLNNSTDLGLILEACQNETFYDKYELKVRLDDELSCISADGSNINKKMVLDKFDIAVGIVLLAFVILNIVGSYFDVNYSDEAKTGVVPQILVSFSLSRNWKNLTSSFNEVHDSRLERLKGIHGIRVISTTLVTMAHSLLPSVLFVENPQFVEEIYKMHLFHVLVNGTLIMQTFLVISGFLLIYNLQMLAEKNTITWRTLIKIFFKRLFRLTPPYAVMLAVTVSLLPHIANGPFWQKVVVTESNECRTDWWMNLLYFNNCISGSHCMPQTWYLATDTQLYAVGLVVFLLGRDLELRKKLLGGLFLLGLVIPAVLTIYFEDLEGHLLISPTLVKIVALNLFVNDPTYNILYRPSHTNLSGYVIGLSLGYLLYHLQKTGFNASKYKKWRPIYWSLVPLGSVIIAYHKVYYDGPRLGLGYRVLGAMLNKPLFAVCMAAILLGFFVKLENVYRSVVEWGGWKPLSRVSYSVYLLHIAYIRTWTALNTNTFHVSHQRMIEVVSWTITLTWLGGIVFWLTIEAPLGHVTKLLLEPTKPKPKKDL